MPPQRLVASGYAEYHPIANNKTAAGRARNRRIEILLTPSLAPEGDRQGEAHRRGREDQVGRCGARQAEDEVEEVGGAAPVGFGVFPPPLRPGVTIFEGIPGRSLSLLLCALLASSALGGCRRPDRAASRPDWDRAAFALELARDEYPELVESNDFRGVPALLAVLDDARAGLGAPDARTSWLTRGLTELRATLARHEGPRVAARTSARLLAKLAETNAPLGRPRVRPDLARGAATYTVACVPCHGPPGGPPPPGAAHLLPPPPRPTESVLTPYELFNRVTYGGAGTAMPSFAETLSADRRWDVAFYLFAARWPACADDPKLPSLAAADLAQASDYDLWRRYGWGAAPCLRRSFH